MMCRSWKSVAWTMTCLGIAAMAAPADGADLRGGNGTRSSHRLAALQIEEGSELEDPAAPPAPPVRRPPPPPPPPPTKAPALVPQPALPPIAEPMWDANVVPPDACADGTCGPCEETMGCHGSWGSLEYLLWWRDGRRTPPLITTTTTVVDPSVDARIGNPNTRLLLGRDLYGDRLLPGGRLDFGMWLDQCRSLGVGFRFTGLGDDDFRYTTNSNVHPVLAVPFFNLDPAVDSQDTLLVAHPQDATTGSINVRGHNEVYLGDLYLRLAGARTADYRVDIIGGYTFSRINEDLFLQTNTTLGANEIIVRDRFRTKNEYHGGSIGLLSEVDRGPWRVNLLTRLALTNVQQTSIIDGTTNIGGVLQTPRSGLFAQPSNIGVLTRDEFALIPELGLNFIYSIGCGADLTVGYSLVYWSETARPGDQINPRIDPTQATARPAPNLVSDDYWVQGFNFGVAWKY